MISHAVTRHGADATAARQACSENQNVELWFNPQSKYCAYGSETADGVALRVFKWVEGEFQEVTAFVYRNATPFAEYMILRGYVNLSWLE